MALLKELCWESGNPRWVIHGTPAGGAGLLGCLEAGCSVVALCFDDHHRTHLSRLMTERAAESMVAGTTIIFKEEALRAKSIDLQLTKPAPAVSAEDQESKVEDKKDKNKAGKKRKTPEANDETPKQGMKQNAKKTQKEEDEDSEDSDEASEDQ